MTAAFAGRRSRLALAVGAILVAIPLYVRLVWHPLAAARADAMAEIARDDAVRARRGIDRVATADVAMVVAASAARARLTIRRIEPGYGAVRVIMPNTGFDRTMTWLAAIERDAGLRVSAITVTRRRAPGSVDVDVRLAR